MTIIMKRNILKFILFSFLFGCLKDENYPKPISNSINKIMSLGASRVEGERPNFESYRYDLWKILVENNWTLFLFVIELIKIFL